MINVVDENTKHRWRKSKQFELSTKTFFASSFFIFPPPWYFALFFPILEDKQTTTKCNWWNVRPVVPWKSIRNVKYRWRKLQIKKNRVSGWYDFSALFFSLWLTQISKRLFWNKFSNKLKVVNSMRRRDSRYTNH